MAIVDQSGLAGKTRDKPIGSKLEEILKKAAEAAGVDVVRVTSGSQPGTHGRSTGSTRHNNGRAADLQLIKNGLALVFSDQSGGSVVEAFIAAAAALGATGIGAGINYMGDKTIHVGFGTSVDDHSKIVWGAGGKSVNAPAWLRAAAKRGWDNSSTMVSGPAISTKAVGQYVVVARGGLNLRKGPSLEFETTKTLPTGTKVQVLGFDGAGDAWARVDLEGDGLVDGHLFLAFLRPVDPDAPMEDAEEPGA